MSNHDRERLLAAAQLCSIFLLLLPLVNCLHLRHLPSHVWTFPIPFPIPLGTGSQRLVVLSCLWGLNPPHRTPPHGRARPSLSSGPFLQGLVPHADNYYGLIPATA